MKLIKLSTLVLPAAGVGVALLLIAPPDARAYTLLGYQLPQAQRSVRVYNNFTDASANNNTTVDANFPGALGATLAIWKACAEWNAGLHNGNGNGDPHQNGALGSGGSNFEISWQGEANAVGAVGDNTHSEISGSSGGVLAYCESTATGSSSNGWRIRYYAGWTWNDGPTTSVGTNEDIQAIACHEYGHALGMGHANADGNATMWASYPSPSGSRVAQRSINSDDIAGVQSIYFAEDTLVKPRITSVSGSGPVITITGANFAATNNEVWFTQADPALNTTAVKAVGLTSNGTSLTFNVPFGAGPGEIQVKSGSIGGPKGLSNSRAIIPNTACTGSVVNYCTAGFTSSFCVAEMSATGTPSVSASSGFTLTCSAMEGQRSGLIFYGVTGRNAAVWAPGSSSYLCVKSPVQRTPSANSGGTNNGCDGVISIDWNDYAATHPSAAGQPYTVGQVIDAQCWFRDPPAPGTTNLSDGIEFTLCP